MTGALARAYADWLECEAIARATDRKENAPMDRNPEFAESVAADLIAGHIVLMDRADWEVVLPVVTAAGYRSHAVSSPDGTRVTASVRPTRRIADNNEREV